MTSAQQGLEQMAAAPAAAPPSPIPAAALTLLVLLAGGIDVTRYLLEFLTPRKQRMLLNTSRELADIKKHLLYWKLTWDQCKIFYAQPAFRSQLEALVHDPSLQLSLRLTGYGITDVSALGNVHTLKLSNCKGVVDVSCLGKRGVQDLMYRANFNAIESFLQKLLTFSC
jgi:hypothetical protein